MSIEKGITCSYTPDIYAEGYIAFVCPFVSRGKQCLWTTCIFFRVICLDCWKDHIGTLDSGERSLLFGLLVMFSIGVPGHHRECIDEVMICPTTPCQWRSIAAEFYQKWNFPHAFGALDGKHIAVRGPGGSGSTYFNYKQLYSVVLLALLDANYKFLWADIGGRGSASDV